MSAKLKGAVLALLLLGVLMPAGSAPAAAAGGSRCHGSSRPGCGAGAEPICLCPSRQASDSECRWVCGSLG